MKIEIGNGGMGSSIIFILVVGFFIPPVWPVLIVIGIAMWIASLVADRQIVAIPETSKTPLPVEATISDEDANEKIHAAKAEAARIAASTPCSHEGRKRVFERVFRRECEKQGVAVSKFTWKRNEVTA